MNGAVKMRNGLWTEMRNSTNGKSGNHKTQRWEKKEIGEISDCVFSGGNRITILAIGGMREFEYGVV
jgi:hypothetical protein